MVFVSSQPPPYLARSEHMLDALADGRPRLLDTGVDTSCKTAFIMSLLAELVAKGHRTLIFSQSRVMLDILQAAICQQSYPFRRIDGSISSATARQVRHSNHL